MPFLRRLFPHGWISALVLYVFLLYLGIGIFVHADYGVSADEPAVRKFGMDAFNYLFHGGAIPTELDWTFYSPMLSIFLHILERAFQLTDGAHIWAMRHLVRFLFFFSTIIGFYHVARMRYRDWKLPLLGSLMFMLSPRLFVHAFVNPKDAPAMFLFMMSAWTLLIFLEHRRWWSFALHILATAVLISMRIFGLLIPMSALLFLWTDLGARNRQEFARWASSYLLLLGITLIAVWPLLWSNPLNVIGAFTNTTSRLGGGFYFGEAFSTAGVPWHYLPVWIGITTPVVYSLFFLIGFVTLMIRCARNPRCIVEEKRPTALALIWFTLPVLALWTLQIGIFDEWRHMLFLYPAFLLIALEGVWWAAAMLKKRHAYAQIVVYGLAGVQLMSTGAWMIRNHPFEYVYFGVPTSLVAGQFDLDYWGLSYRPGLEWVVNHDGREHINVAVISRVGKAGADTLPLEEWNRLYFVDADQADYVVDNFRDTDYRDPYPPEREVHAITVDGLKILGIYRKAVAE